MGAYGYGRNTTPHLDEFAKQAAVFEKTYSHSPWTMPSIASMFTSLSPREHGIAAWKDPLAKSFITLAEQLKNNGYNTYAAVSHDIIIPRYGFGQGFDEYDTSILKKGKSLNIFSSKHITDYGIRTIDKQTKGAPFFMFLHYFDPHKKYFTHKDHKFGDTPLDKYDSEIAFTDHHVNRLLEHLNKKGFGEDTIVVFVADHGEEFGEHGGRYHGWKIYNEVVHIPLIIKVPGFKPQRVPTVISESDIPPTLLNLVGVQVPDQFQGKSISFSGKKFTPEKGRTIFMETYFMSEVCKRGVLKDDWKLILDCNNSSWGLYDLSKDPGENKNLATVSAGEFDRMKQLLISYYPLGTPKPKMKELTEELKQKLKSLGYIN